MADINSTIQLNYSAEDINALLAKVSNLENLVNTLINDAIQAERKYTKKIDKLKRIITSNLFRGNYTPVGNYSIEDNKVSVNYNLTETSPESIMNDFARFLGSLYENGISKIEFNNVEYTWDSNKNLQGSNFVDENDITLVSVVTSEFQKQPEGTTHYEGIFKIDDIEMIYSVNIQV